jgi:cytidylate kinase
MNTLPSFLSAYGHVIAKREQEEAGKRKCVPPIVLSRQAGSGGRIIADELARKLGFELCDKAILDEIATRSKVPKDFLELLDERPAKVLELLGAGLLRGVSITSEDYDRVLKSTMRAFLELGSVVIVGRGGAFLARPGKALRVRVVAPMEVRIRNFAGYGNISEEKARIQIEAIEKERRQFLKRVFGQMDGGMECFDIGVNTQTLSVGDCVALILEAYERVCGCRPCAKANPEPAGQNPPQPE